MKRKFSYHPPPIIMSCSLLFNGASNSVTDFLSSPSCYQLLLYFQSVKLTSWSVSWIQLSDYVQLKIAKSCKCALLEFSFVKGRGRGLRGAINCRSFKICALQCEFSLAVVGKYLLISAIVKVAFKLYLYFILNSEHFI